MAKPKTLESLISEQVYWFCFSVVNIWPSCFSI